MTQEHYDLQRRCLTWLANRCMTNGIQGREEFGIKEGYVADAFAMVSAYQCRYLQDIASPEIQEYFKPRRNEWIQEDGELVFKRPEKDRALRDSLNMYFSVIFEVKISNSDLLNTFKDGNSGRLDPVGEFHYLVISKAVTTDLHIIPKFWGIIRATEKTFRMVRQPEYCAVAMEDKCRLIMYLLENTKSYLAQEYAFIRQCPDCKKLTYNDNDWNKQPEGKESKC